MRLFVFVFLSFWIASCATGVKSFSWLNGTWEMPTKRGYLYEVWQTPKAKKINGESYLISDGKKMPREKLEIKLENGSFWYVPTVFDQNEGNPVLFKLVGSNDKRKFTFENKAHDYPQRIYYEFRPLSENHIAAGDTLIARIEGESNGQSRSSIYKFVRKKIE